MTPLPSDAEKPASALIVTEIFCKCCAAETFSAPNEDKVSAKPKNKDINVFFITPKNVTLPILASKQKRIKRN